MHVPWVSIATHTKTCILPIDCQRFALIWKKNILKRSMRFCLNRLFDVHILTSTIALASYYFYFSFFFFLFVDGFFSHLLYSINFLFDFVDSLAFLLIFFCSFFHSIFRCSVASYARPIAKDYKNLIKIFTKRNFQMTFRFSVEKFYLHKLCSLFVCSVLLITLPHTHIHTYHAHIANTNVFWDDQESGVDESTNNDRIDDLTLYGWCSLL